MDRVATNRGIQRSDIIREATRYFLADDSQLTEQERIDVGSKIVDPTNAWKRTSHRSRTLSFVCRAEGPLTCHNPIDGRGSRRIVLQVEVHRETDVRSRESEVRFNSILESREIVRKHSKRALFPGKRALFQMATPKSLGL